MDKWDYLIIGTSLAYKKDSEFAKMLIENGVPQDPKYEDREFYKFSDVDILKYYGKQGWELVSVTGRRYTFKKLLTD